MNQILVTEKIYVTPELKRKKKIYKINFILSVVAIVILCSFYAHSEYARNKDEDISQDILEGIVEEEMNEAERVAASEEESVWKIMISEIQQQNESNKNNSQQDMQNETQYNSQSNNQKVDQSDIDNDSNNKSKSSSKKDSSKKKIKYITASNGKRYPSVGRIEIPKIGVNYAILAQTSGDTLVDWLKVSPVMFWGVYPNEIGNLSIAGHNYRNKRFFSKVPTLKIGKVPTLKIGDRIKITDASGKKVNYTVFDKYEVSPKNTDCINDVPGKENKRVVTLITCTNDSKKRVIVQAEAN